MNYFRSVEAAAAYFVFYWVTILDVEKNRVIRKFISHKRMNGSAEEKASKALGPEPDQFMN